LVKRGELDAARLRRSPRRKVGQLRRRVTSSIRNIAKAIRQASRQLQLDVWGEVIDAFHLAREGGLAASPSGRSMQCRAMQKLEHIWNEPDEGIREMRGPRRHFTHSKVMAWVAFDCSIRDATRYGLKAPLERWRAIRDEIFPQAFSHLAMVHTALSLHAARPLRQELEQMRTNP
jgi:GH15 family glucan-1,4-alpha-glucosidase